MTTRVLRIPLAITDLHRDERGHWVARVNDTPVFRTFGSWQMAADGLRMRDVLPYIADELQKQVRVLERRERKEERNGSNGSDSP